MNKLQYVWGKLAEEAFAVGGLLLKAQQVGLGDRKFVEELQCKLDDLFCIKNLFSTYFGVRWVDEDCRDRVVEREKVFLNNIYGYEESKKPPIDYQLLIARLNREVSYLASSACYAQLISINYKHIEPYESHIHSLRLGFYVVWLCIGLLNKDFGFNYKNKAQFSHNNQLIPDHIERLKRGLTL